MRFLVYIVHPSEFRASLLNLKIDLYFVGVHDSIDLTKYTSMVLKVYNVRVETGWEKRVGGLNRDMSGGEYSIQCKTVGKGYI